MGPRGQVDLRDRGAPADRRSPPPPTEEKTHGRAAVGGRTVLGWNFSPAARRGRPLPSFGANGADAPDAPRRRRPRPRPRSSDEGPADRLQDGFRSAEPRAGIICACGHPHRRVAGRPSDDPIFSINARARARRASGGHVVTPASAPCSTTRARWRSMTVVEAFRAVPTDRAAAALRSRATRRSPRPSSTTCSVIQRWPTWRSRPDPGRDRGAAQRDDELHRAGAGDVHLQLLLERTGSSRATTCARWTRSRCSRRAAFDVEAFESGLVAQLERRARARDPQLPLPQPDRLHPRRGRVARRRRGPRPGGGAGPVALLVDLATRFGSQDRPAWSAPWSRSPTRSRSWPWTASKSFAQYGARVGALVAAVPDAERQRVASAMSFSCRGSQFNCNLGILAITSIMEDESLRDRVDAERRARRADDPARRGVQSRRQARPRLSATREGSSSPSSA